MVTEPTVIAALDGGTTVNHFEYVLRALGEDPSDPAPADLADRALIRARAHPVRLAILALASRLLVDNRQSK